MPPKRKYKYATKFNKPYTVHCPYYEPLFPTAASEVVQYTSIDPGITYFACRVECRYSSGLIEMKLFELINFEHDVNPYAAVTRYFDARRELLSRSNVVLIEEQFTENHSKVRFGQHLLTYMMELFRGSPLRTPILEINAKCKGKCLGVPDGLTDHFYKKWMIEKAKELFTLRRDAESLSILEQNKGPRAQKKKQDDLSDATLAIEAFCVLNRLPLTEAWGGVELEIVEAPRPKPEIEIVIET